MDSQGWQKLIQEKRADREARIPPQWCLAQNITSQVHDKSDVSAFDLLSQTNLLTQREHEITEKYGASTLIHMMTQGILSSVEVTTAFCKRAAIAQQLTNCLTEIFFQKALERAEECDAFLTREGRPMGPFHGLPISLKDMLMVKGEAATLGFVSYLAKPLADENSVIVDMLLEAGAVLYCKTNVPQTLFICEGMNNVFGCTLNPHKLSLTPSGSSSGEGALVGFRGSPLGVGSDIGGSVRAPSLCCGAFGFKPTANRLPWGGQQHLIPKGWPGVVPTLGPHAQRAEDLTLFCKTIIRGEPWKRDSTTSFAPWREVPRKTSLKIGLWVQDEALPVFPPVARTLREAAAALKAAGHDIIPVHNPVPLIKGGIIFGKANKLDPKNSIFQILSDGQEPPVPALIGLERELPLEDREYNLVDLWDFNGDRDDYRDAWHKVWVGKQIDILLCPGARGTAVPHGKFGVPWYTMIWNLLNCPASVIPYLTADAAIDSKEMEGCKSYDPQAAHGAPCSVQVVGWTGQDEEVLMATEILADTLRGEVE
ncbi:amidase signature domain-containing protein [Dactylonectria macrodidyma]|uniref:Amidase signature domain-containing protein n=1 Tax=Dactylonectria macrodidyma TaxID=307937 RepID=A0A9P9E4P5_9HYPO|nr:amidase signature domain-containing protein [Dactylonectria macrodidyma]